jgi:hypothetical protein
VIKFVNDLQQVGGFLCVLRFPPPIKLDNLDLAWVPFAVDSFLYSVCLIFCLMVFNATFNNISVISWQSVLLVEETGGHRENHRLVDI